MTDSHLGFIFAAAAEDGLRGGAPQRQAASLLLILVAPANRRHALNDDRLDYHH